MFAKFMLSADDKKPQEGKEFTATPGPKVDFFMLITTEHEPSTAHKNKDSSCF